MDLKFLLALVCALVLQVPAEAQLIAFVSSKDAAVTATWKTEQLPFLKQLADEQGSSLRVIDIAELGAPPEVGITPLLVFQDHRGRSIYQGRSSNQTRMTNFLRTSRAIGQSDKPWTRQNIPVWQCERAKIAAPIKVTPLAGNLPADHDAETFEAETKQAIIAGLERFKLVEEVQFGRADRTFYFDFYPYRDESDQFFVSVALFSQFHCKEAIFTGEESFSGSWAKRAEVLARAAQELETAMVRLMQESKIGDAFDCVPSTTKTVNWKALELSLPSAPTGLQTVASTLQLAEKWRVAEATENAAPRVLFHFPSPLDGTAGEVGEVTGTLQLGEGATIKGAHGQVVVEVESITLGFEDLDQVVKSVVMLDANNHPQASFTFVKVLSQEGPLEFGRQTRTLIAGTFEMKGKAKPIEVSALWEPIVNGKGEPRLLIDGAFSIRLLEPFGIKGPDGPSPQRDTLLFHIALELVPE